MFYSQTIRYGMIVLQVNPVVAACRRGNYTET